MSRVCKLISIVLKTEILPCWNYIWILINNMYVNLCVKNYHEGSLCHKRVLAKANKWWKVNIWYIASVTHKKKYDMHAHLTKHSAWEWKENRIFSFRDNEYIHVLHTHVSHVTHCKCCCCCCCLPYNINNNYSLCFFLSFISIFEKIIIRVHTQQLIPTGSELIYYSIRR